MQENLAGKTGELAARHRSGRYAHIVDLSNLSAEAQELRRVDTGHKRRLAGVCALTL